MNNKLTITLIAIFTGMLLLSSFFTNNNLNAIEVGSEAPNFTLNTHDGKSLTLENLKGKRATVLAFFATWCPSCMAEVPEMKAFVETVKDKKILVYGVNIQQSLAVVKDFVESYDINYRILLDTEAVVAQKYGVFGIPYIVGIDGAGKVIFAAHGLPLDQEKFIKELTAPLSDGNGKGETIKNKDSEDEKVSAVDRETLEKWRKEKKDMVIIDVLSPESYKSGHIAGAINIPLKDIDSAKDKFDKDALIVTYCANFQCKASTQAAEKLMELGFTNIHDYEGGKKDWQDGGLEMAPENN